MSFVTLGKFLGKLFEADVDHRIQLIFRRTADTVSYCIAIITIKESIFETKDAIIVLSVARDLHL